MLHKEKSTIKRIIGFLMMVGLVVDVGCSGDKSPTGPSGRTIETYTDKWDNGNKSIEYTYYYDGSFRIRHGYYRKYAENRTLIFEGNTKKGNDGTASFFSMCGGFQLGPMTVGGTVPGDSVTKGTSLQYLPIAMAFGRGNPFCMNGVLNGVSVGYYKNGKTSFTLNYKDGKADRTLPRYNTEGSIIKESGKE